MALSKIELKLIDDDGNYSKATIEYPGYINMQAEHNVNMVVDVLNHMVWEYDTKGKTEFTSDIKQ